MTNYRAKITFLSYNNDPHLSNEFGFEKANEVFLQEKIDASPASIYIKPEKIKFSKLKNVQNQTLSYYLAENPDEIKHKFVQKGCYKTIEIISIFQDFFEDKLKFEPKQNSNQFTGKLTVKNTTNNDIVVIMNKNLGLLTGMSDANQIVNKNEHFNAYFPAGETFDFKFDWSRTICDIRLYSRFLFNYKNELCSKVLTNAELNFLKEDDDVDFGYCNNILNLNCRSFKVDRCQIKNTSFYFEDIFEENLDFEYAELVIFISNKPC